MTTATIPDPASSPNVQADSGSSPVAAYLERFQKLATVQEQIVGEIGLIKDLAEECGGCRWMSLAEKLVAAGEWISPRQYLESVQDLEKELKTWWKLSKEVQKQWEALTENQKVGLSSPSQLPTEFTHFSKDRLKKFLKPATQKLCHPHVISFDELKQPEEIPVAGISIGSKVRLKSGGPIMTVTAEAESIRTFVCTWFTSTSGMLGGGGDEREWRAASIEVRQESLDLVPTE